MKCIKEYNGGTVVSDPYANLEGGRNAPKSCLTTIKTVEEAEGEGNRRRGRRSVPVKLSAQRRKGVL